MKKRDEFEKIKLKNSLCSNLPKSVSKSLGNRVIMKEVPANFSRNKIALWYLKKLNTKRLFYVWKSTITKWSKRFEEVEKLLNR